MSRFDRHRNQTQWLIALCEKEARYVKAQRTSPIDGGHLKEAFGINGVAFGEETHLVEDGDSIGGVEVDDGISAQTDIDAGGEHVLVTVRAEVLLGAEVGAPAWAVRDGGVGQGKGLDRCVGGIVDMRNKE